MKYIESVKIRKIKTLEVNDLEGNPNALIRIPYKLLAETETKPGLGSDGKIAEDLKDVSFLKEIQEKQKKYWNKHNIIFNKTDDELFALVKLLFTYTSLTGLYKEAMEMLNVFYKGFGKTYKNPRLAGAAFGHDEFRKYHDKILKSIKAVIHEETADLKFMNDKSLYIPRLSFNNFFDNLNGIGITIHQVYATKIELINYFCDTDKRYWTGTFRYTLYDHFGLDWVDILKHGEDNIPPQGGDGFKAWYLLQRYRKTKPFIVELKKDIFCNGKF